jgi:hypothetical protein
MISVSFIVLLSELKRTEQLSREGRLLVDVFQELIGHYRLTLGKAQAGRRSILRPRILVSVVVRRQPRQALQVPANQAKKAHWSIHES